jgi:hypothetical protein
MRTPVLVAAVAAWHCLLAQGSIWFDPDFHTMVEDAQLIAVVEVTEGGGFVCTVKAVDALKGSAPEAPFKVGGYNNAWWPADAVVEQAMKKGDRVLMFLSPRKIEDFSAGRGQQPKVMDGWSVPTPSSGDMRIQDGTLHGSWYFVSYPNVAPGVDAELVLALIRGYVEHLAGRPPTAARKLLKERLTVQAIKAVKAEPEDEDEHITPADAEAMMQMHWLLCAQSEYGEPALAAPVLAACESKNLLVQICGARALRSLNVAEPVEQMAAKLLLVDHSLVQAEACRALIAHPFEKEHVAAMLKKAIPKSNPRRHGAGSSLMNPILNVSASGRELMVRVATHYGLAEELHDELLALIRDEGLNGGVFAALSDHFLKYRSEKARARFLSLYARCPSEAARFFQTYLLAEKSDVSLAAVAEKLKSASLDELDRKDGIKAYLAALSLDDPRARAIVRELPKIFPKEDFTVEACVEALIQEASPDALRLAADQIRKAELSPFQRGGLLVEFAEGVAPDDPLLEPMVFDLLEQHGKGRDALGRYVDGDSPEDFWAACVAAASERVERSLKEVPEPKKPWGAADTEAKALLDQVREAVSLKLRPPADGKQCVEAWAALLIQSIQTYHTTTLIARELRRAAGETLRDHAVATLREKAPKPVATVILAAIRDLGGSLSDKEKTRLEKE